MTDLMETLIGVKLRRALMLSSSLAWYETFDQQLKTMILNWIQQDQLFKEGINEDGKVIGLYSEWTEFLNPKKVAGTHYTLYDTGDFYKSMYIVVLIDSIVIEADGIKTKATEFDFDVVNLFEEYGEGIIGLTEENMDKLREEVKKKYIQFVKNALELD